MSTSARSTADRRQSRGLPKIAVLIPIIVLIAWFSYVWFISGVLPSVEKDPKTGRIVAEGYVKRVGLGDYRKHGHWVTYHSNKQKASEGAYQLGEKTGSWSYWDESGKLLDTPASAPAVTRVP